MDDDREWYGEFYEGMRDIVHKLSAFLVIICAIGACVVVSTMDKPSEATFGDASSLTLIGLLVGGALFTFIWHKTAE